MQKTQQIKIMKAFFIPVISISTKISHCNSQYSICIIKRCDFSNI